MCGRYVLLKRDVTELMKRLRLEELLKSVSGESRYNIAPTQPVVTICRDGAGAADARQLKPAMMSWGWHLPGDGVSKPHFVINARGETLRQRPAFRDVFKTSRCVLAASGYYEWKRSGRIPQPHLIQCQDEEPFFMAGLWRPAAEGADKCIVVTTQANSLTEQVHHRMPVILTPEAALTWMLAGSDEMDTLKKLIAPFPAERMQARPVSTHVNSARNEGELCVSSPAGNPTSGEEADAAGAGNDPDKSRGGGDEQLGLGF